MLKCLLALALASSTLSSRAGADELDRAIEAEMARQQVAGLTLAIVRNGEIVRLGAYGYGDLEWRSKASPDTRFEIASMSKMFTGAAVRILMDEGRLDPETAVSRYFDALPDSWTGIKVRHLVTMSTGLPEDWGGDLIPYDTDVTTAYDDASMLRAFTTLKMEAPPGTEFHYSSPGYAMLGMLVSRLSGAPLPEFVAERVFKPASMDRSTFIDNGEIVPERAQGYRQVGGRIKRGWYLGQYLHARPDVGVLSTARDMARWVIALRAGRIVKDAGRLWAGASVVVLSNCDYASVDRFALMAARQYLADLPDPRVESEKPDANPALTASVIASLRSLSQGRIDPTSTNPDALDPLTMGDASAFLKDVEACAQAGTRRLPGNGLIVHGHRLVDYVTIRLRVSAGARFLTVYRDERDRIAYLELTE